MKKNYFTICLLLWSAAAFSQFTLDATNTNTEIPTSFKIYHGDTSVFTPGTAGANGTYDFSSIAILDSSTASFTAFDISASPDLYYQSSAPDYRLTFGINHHFYLANANGLTLAGRATSSSNNPNIYEIMPYKNNATVSIFSYPFAFQDTESNTGIELDYATVEYDETSGNYFPVTGSVGGNVDVAYDGHGTFTTPDGKTVSNVARIKITESFAKTIGGSIETVNNVFYEYREEFNKHWIARIENLSITTNGGTVLARKNNYFVESSVFVNVNELIANSTPFVTYPNPTNSEAMCKFELNNNSKVKITITNILGHEVVAVSETNMPKGQYNIPINLNNFAAGYYLVKLQVNNDIQAQKIQKL